MDLNKKLKKGFTLAEVLITLAVIGVVAAVTIPVVIHNYNKQNTVVKLKAAYAILTETIHAAEAARGSTSSWYSADDVFLYDSSGSGEQRSNIIEGFANTYLVPYMNVVDSGKKPLKDFGYKNGIFRPNGKVYAPGDYSLQGISLSNGMFIQVTTGHRRYNNNPNDTKSWVTEIVLNIDIDGPNHGANAFGKDIFSFEKYLSNDLNLSKIIPYGLYNALHYPTTHTFTYTFMSRDLLMNDCQDSGSFCAALIITDGWQIKEDYPWF